MSGAGGMVALGLLLVAAGAGLYLAGGKGKEGERRAAAAEVRARDAEAARSAADQVQRARVGDLEARIEALRKQVDDLEAAGRAREAELLAVRAELERARRIAEEESRRAAVARTPEMPIRGIPEEPKPPEPVKAAAPEKPPAPSLGPTAVSDPNQVKKLTDGLNALLAGVGGGETWRVVSARAVEDDRLVQVVLEARGTDGTVVKAFQAGEGRFVLQAAAGTLSIKLREGSVTYPGNRTVPFPEGSYTVLLVVDSGPFRAAGNPLVTIQ